jgi:hypothetical protein
MHSLRVVKVAVNGRASGEGRAAGPYKCRKSSFETPTEFGKSVRRDANVSGVASAIPRLHARLAALANRLFRMSRAARLAARAALLRLNEGR